MASMDQVFPYILNGLGGAALAPLVAGMLGGKGLGALGNVVAGIIGGLGAGAGVEAAGLGDLFGPGQTIVGYVQDLVEGAIGGALLGTIACVMKGKTHA
jgi:hypothetical protein